MQMLPSNDMTIWKRNIYTQINVEMIVENMIWKKRMGFCIKTSSRPGSVINIKFSKGWVLYDNGFSYFLS